MYIYKKGFAQYFDPCDNCGECCKIPGLFLPEQIEALADHFDMTPRELFDDCLIAELSQPGAGLPLTIAFSPVKVDADGRRLPQKLIDHEYAGIRNLNCVFRDAKQKVCLIHDLKPFACDIMLCSKMTRANSLCLEKPYYYFRWAKRPEVVLSILPELKGVLDDLAGTASEIKGQIEKRNKLINEALAGGFIGHSVESLPINP